MKNMTAHIRNFTKLQSNQAQIKRNEEAGAEKTRELRKKLNEIQNEIYRQEGIVANQNNAMIEENQKISTNKPFIAFFQKLQVVFKDLGIKQKDHDRFMMLFRQAFNGKYQFFYYCTADPRKSTCNKPSNMSLFKVVNLAEVEVMDRAKKIEKLFENE